jgi:hypothetical protein
MIGYYIHHCGFGHLARAMSICAELDCPATALSSLDIPAPHPFAAIVKLPRDDQAERVSEPTANGALHWAPHHDSGFQARMNLVARWIAEERPQAVVTDVSVEIAVLARVLGIPVIVMALPGKRVDVAHQLVHQLADHIVAAWPAQLCEPIWLRPYAHKTSYVGGISRFDGRDPYRFSCEPGRTSTRVRVLVLGGADDTFGGALAECTQTSRATVWTALGGASGLWKDDPWPQICTSDVVVTHAGQSCIADVAAAGRPAVVIPQPRPFDEQIATAAVLRRHNLATVAQCWPGVGTWPQLLDDALSGEPRRWERWQTRGAVARAAAAIEATAQRHATVASM